ncbi:MAG TPA: cysteine--tRNA ligase [Verrucomicrobiae bacterium]
MALKLFNTLTRSVENFSPLNPNAKKVGMYCCGPTVYDYAHIGNWRTFVFADLVRRTLEFSGYDVQHVMNITDIEDKIIKRVREQKTTLREFTGKFETAFLDDLKALNCKEPHVKPRATEYIAEIISLIEKLIARGIAYKANDGSVYFSITKYQGCGCNYGQLLKLNFDEMRAGERVSSDEYEKESVADFALWKARVPDDGDIFWPSPFGEGRPGWHIECSAMSMKVLGESFDLHLGGEDLKFPHHEDEIAQSEGATGKPFVKHWLHGAHLLVEGKKMSKSLGNYFTLRDLQAKGFTGREVRYLLLTAHYRETFNFTLDGLTGAKTALARIDETIDRLREIAGDTVVDPNDPREHEYPYHGELRKNFKEALEADFNVSAMWASIHDWLRNHRKADLLFNQKVGPSGFAAREAAVSLALWKQIDQVLGLGDRFIEEIPAEISALADERIAAKKAKDFKRSDAIRDELKAKGWVIEDTPKGIKLKKI